MNVLTKWSLVALITLLFSVAGCRNAEHGAVPGGAMPPKEQGEQPAPSPIQMEQERGGVRLTLRMDRSRYGPGEVLWAHVRIENTNRHPVVWKGGGCNIPATVEARIPSLQDRGKTWPGIIGTVKEQMLTSGLDESRIPFVEERFFRQPNGPNCPDDIRNLQLTPGEVLEARLAWDGMVPFDPEPLRAPAGPMHVRARFPLGGMESEQPLEAEITVALTGGRAALLSRGQVFDAALASETFKTWLEARRSADGLVTSLRLESGRWRLRVTEKGGPRPNQAQVHIDPVSGNLHQADLDDG